MHRVDDPSAVPTLPTPKQPGIAGYFSDGSPATGTQATIVTDDWANAVQEEIATVIEAAGITLSKSDHTQLLQALQRLTRKRISNNITFYVSPTGNNANDGLSAATAWADPTFAYNTIREYYDLAGFTATIQLADGNYTNLLCTYPCNGPVLFQGNTADPSRVTINGSGTSAVVATDSAYITCDSFTVTASGLQDQTHLGGHGLMVWGAANIQFSNIRFGACQMHHIYTEWGGMIQVRDGTGIPYTIVGGAQCHAMADGNSTVWLVGAKPTLIGTPNFTSAFANCANAACLGAQGAVFTGAATGVRYYASQNGIIGTASGANPNFFPGSSPGSVASGGIYT